MDHRRIDIAASQISCGVTQLSRISDDLIDVLFAIGTRFYHAAHGQPPAFAIWSNLANEETNGHKLAALAESLDLGVVMQSGKEVNPNTGSVICIWTWQIKHETYKEWYKQAKIAKLQKQYPQKE